VRAGQGRAIPRPALRGRLAPAGPVPGGGARNRPARPRRRRPAPAASAARLIRRRAIRTPVHPVSDEIASNIPIWWTCSVGPPETPALQLATDPRPAEFAHSRTGRL